MSAPGPEGFALVIGEALVDVVIRDDAPTVEIPGGSPANVALGLARLERNAKLSCWIGKDARGQAVRSHLEASGVELIPGSDGAPRTSTAEATIGETGAATYNFHLDWNPPAPHPDDKPLLVHTGSIAAMLEPGASTVEEVLRTYRDSATITYDPNARPQLMGEPEQARKTAENLISMADLVKCSDEDVEWLTGSDDLEGALREWLKLGPAIVVVTRGKAGALVMTSSGLRVEVPADPSVVVADTVGAGDSFMGGLIDAIWFEDLVGADQREALHNLDAEVLQRIVRHAATIADITVSRAGANPPTREELIEVWSQKHPVS